MRTASSSGSTNTLPSPMLPVLAAAVISATTLSTRPSATTTSTFILGRKSTVYSLPRYISVGPFWRPKPRTSVTVMPMMPAPVSASFTSSSLNGLMIASIFFISRSPRAPGRHRHRGRLHRRCAHRVDERRRPMHLRVAVGAHLGYVEPFQLDLGADAHAEGEVVDLEEGPRRAEDEAEVDERTDDLGDELAWVAVEDPLHRARHPVEAVAIGAVGEDSEAQHPPGAAGPMDGDRADRVVHLHRPLDEEHGPADEHASERADHESPEARHEGARRGDRHEPRQHAVDHHARVGLAVFRPHVEHREDRPRRRRQHGVDGDDRDAKVPACERAAGVEAEPPER